MLILISETDSQKEYKVKIVLLAQFYIVLWYVNSLKLDTLWW